MTYGAPTNLDLSACSVSADGGKTSQTLAEVAAAVEGNATAVAQAQTDATDAKIAAEAASSDASVAKTAAAEALPKSSLNTAGGAVGINADGSVTIPAIAPNKMAVINVGGFSQADGIPLGSGANINYNSSDGLPQVTDVFSWNNPDGSATFGRYLDGVLLTGRSSGSLSIGNANQPINTVYAQNATVVTSDAATKTVAGRLTDVSYTDGQKLVAALATVRPTVYQMNTSIAEKGAASARYHVGYIAQDVESAITAAGLDPAKFGMWTKTALFTTSEKDGKFTQTPTVDQNGDQVYVQMLRYEEIFPVIAASLSASITTLEARVAALEAKTDTAATTSTTGSAT